METAEFSEIVAWRRNVLFEAAPDPALRPATEPLPRRSTIRQVVLRSEEFDICVRIWNNESGRHIRGRVQSRAAAAVPAVGLHLLQDGERIHSTSTTHLGEFHFDEVPDGFLSLQADLPDVTVIGMLGLARSSQD